MYKTKHSDEYLLFNERRETLKVERLKVYFRVTEERQK